MLNSQQALRRFAEGVWTRLVRYTSALCCVVEGGLSRSLLSDTTARKALVRSYAGHQLLAAVYGEARCRRTSSCLPRSFGQVRFTQVFRYPSYCR